MAKQKRIVCYAINGAGLGHLTRLRTVAKWLRRYASLLDERPPEILFLTSSDASDTLADAGFAAFKIPSKTVARKTELNKLEYRRLAKHFVWNTLGVFSPDLLVVDTFPSGSFDELFQVLDGPFKTSFVYRNVKPEYASRATFRSALRMYDSIVAPHGMIESQRGGFAAHDGELRFSGEVIQFEHEDLLPAEQARRQLGVDPNQKLVYVSAGGGGDCDAEQQLQSLVRALQQMDNVQLLVGAGPLYRGERLAGENVIWYDGPGIANYFAALDAAVSAAGYNPFHELLFARVPTAFYAQDKIADDQSERIASATQVRACERIADWTDATEVLGVVDRMLDESVAAEMRTACESMLPSNGASRCAIELLRPLYDDARLEWAQRVLTPRLANRLEQLTGSAATMAAWLTPLMPQDQMRSLMSHPGIENVINQLSPSAATEVQQVLALSDQSDGHLMIESRLIELLESIARLDPSQQTALADASLKSIVAVMKKQPLGGELQADWATWICDIVDSVARLIKRDATSTADPLGTLEWLRLYRAFPRIVDVDALGAAELFQRLVADHLERGDQVHEINQAIQVLKLTHPRVTKLLLENALAGLTT
ncbi:MAG: hypothetical protein HKN47_03555 [Pirellulaceae bacterium]|nr:hypothetical protein [Pirellulaceae bacterium]